MRNNEKIEEICGALIHVGFEGNTTCANPKPCKMHDYTMCANPDCDGEHVEATSNPEIHLHPKNLMVAHTDGSQPHPIDARCNKEPCSELRKSAKFDVDEFLAGAEKAGEILERRDASLEERVAKLEAWRDKIQKVWEKAIDNLPQ
jgi:hypothetical protein